MTEKKEIIDLDDQEHTFIENLCKRLKEENGLDISEEEVLEIIVRLIPKLEKDNLREIILEGVEEIRKL